MSDRAARNAEICALARAGWNSYELADRFNLSSAQIGNVLRRNGVYLMRPTHPTAARNRSIVERWRAGEQQKRIAQECKISRGRVWQIVQRARRLAEEAG